MLRCGRKRREYLIAAEIGGILGHHIAVFTIEGRMMKEALKALGPVAFVVGVILLAVANSEQTDATVADQYGLFGVFCVAAGLFAVVWRIAITISERAGFRRR